jgi:hypothetical protein
LCVAGADNSRKAFYKEFKRVVELSDVVIQVSTTEQATTSCSAQLAWQQ